MCNRTDCAGVFAGELACRMCQEGTTMAEFEIEIIFISSNTPKRMKAVATYTKADFFCVQRADGMIIRYPLMNIFQVANMHGPHIGSSVGENPI